MQSAAYLGFIQAKMNGIWHPKRKLVAWKVIEGKLRISEDTIHIYYFIFSAEFVLLRYGSFKNLMRINTRSAKRFRQAA